MERTSKVINGFENNFDLIRLLAALQVAIVHISTHLKWKFPLLDYLEFFPGVPIFFFISGYLIFNSYMKLSVQSDALFRFFVNRFLRLYPALYICFFFSILSVYVSGYFETHVFSIQQFFLYLFSSLTFIQFYNPDFLREYGLGALNGSLWTISVEIQFYILTPILFFLLTRYRRWMMGILGILILLNFVYCLLPCDSLGSKLFGATFFPWLYMFFWGALLAYNQNVLEKILKLKIIYVLPMYIFMYFFCKKYDLGSGNHINFFLYMTLSCLVLKCAFSMPALSRSLLKGNDFSYGIYIYHGPIINFMIFKNQTGSVYYFLMACVLSLFFAAISWFFFERPVLKFKKTVLHHRYALGDFFKIEV